jgi:hypothetical protein
VSGGTEKGLEPMPPHALRDYALLADGERGAVVGPRGEIVWMCALRSRWVTGDGLIECREALAFPGDLHRTVLLRRVIAGHNRARVRVRLDPRAEFGRKSLRSLRHGHGWWAGRLGDLYLRWSGDLNGARALRAGRGSQLLLDLAVPAGTSLDLVLELSDQPFEREPPDADAAWEATEAAWAQDVPQLDGVTAKRDARHAYAVLRGLTSSCGGMVAAATTSLPERADEGRNYDYRYAWIRDQCYAGHAVAAAGLRGGCRPLVRAEQGRVRDCRAVLRGIRRGRTPDARQPPTGVRARPDAGMRRPPRLALETRVTARQRG